MKPLFVPLKKCWFEAFASGKKRVEYRLYGPRWHEGTCIPGRDVVLSCGYSGARLHGTIVGFKKMNSNRVKAARELYGDNVTLAAISVHL